MKWNGSRYYLIWFEFLCISKSFRWNIKLMIINMLVCWYYIKSVCYKEIILSKKKICLVLMSLYLFLFYKNKDFFM